MTEKNKANKGERKMKERNEQENGTSREEAANRIFKGNAQARVIQIKAQCELLEDRTHQVEMVLADQDEAGALLLLGTIDPNSDQCYELNKGLKKIHELVAQANTELDNALRAAKSAW